MPRGPGRDRDKGGKERQPDREAQAKTPGRQTDRLGDTQSDRHGERGRKTQGNKDRATEIMQKVSKVLPAKPKKSDTTYCVQYLAQQRYLRNSW